MNTAPFPQAAIVGSLFAELRRTVDAEVSARSLADAVAPRFPHVPIVLLRALARPILRLAFEPDAITDADIDRAADSPEEAAKDLPMAR
jgi:hypothetical protein